MVDMPNLIGKDIKLMRARYNEALQLQGVPCSYMYPTLATTSNLGESVDDMYSLPIETNIFFEGSPKIKTFKRFGWVVENDKDLPFLIHCSFDLPQVQRDSVFKIAGQYTELPDRTFKVTEISYDIQAPDHIVCQVVPVYDKQISGRTKQEVSSTFNTSHHFLKANTDYRGHSVSQSDRYRRSGKVITKEKYDSFVGVISGDNMLSVRNSDIQLTRGDSASFNLVITKSDGSLYTREDGDKLIFTLKKTYNSAEALLSKEISDFNLVLNPEDTSKLSYGEYWYDVQLTTEDNKVYTVIGPARFVLREEVTF
jgi:hypothetical protein